MAWKPDYITVGELKAFRRIPELDAEDDVELASAITAASRAIDKHTNRQFGKTDAVAERTYTAEYRRGRDGRSEWFLHIDDLMTTTGLIITATAGTVDSYILEPRNAAADGKPWTRLVVAADSAAAPSFTSRTVEVTATWGWTAVPVAVKNACKLQANRFASRRDSPYGIAGSPDAGSEMRLLARVDPDVGVSLSEYVRPRRLG